MCGLVGFLNSKSNGFNLEDIEMLMHSMVLNAFRGMHSTGLSVVESDNHVATLKVLGDPFNLVKNDNWDKVRSALWDKGKMVLGHGRHATKGTVSIDNAHPFHIKTDTKELFLMHNGTLQTWQGHFGGIQTNWGGLEVDSHWMAQKIAELGPEEALGKIRGAIATMWYDVNEKALFVYRNKERPLHFAWSKGGDLFINSDCAPLQHLRNRFLPDYEEKDIFQFAPGSLYKIPLDGKEKNMTCTEIKEISVPINHPTATGGQTQPQTNDSQFTADKVDVGNEATFEDCTPPSSKGTVALTSINGGRNRRRPLTIHNESEDNNDDDPEGERGTAAHEEVKNARKAKYREYLEDLWNKVITKVEYFKYGEDIRVRISYPNSNTTTYLEIPHYSALRSLELTDEGNIKQVFIGNDGDVTTHILNRERYEKGRATGATGNTGPVNPSILRSIAEKGSTHTKQKTKCQADLRAGKICKWTTKVRKADERLARVKSRALVSKHLPNYLGVYYNDTDGTFREGALCAFEVFHVENHGDSNSYVCGTILGASPSNLIGISGWMKGKAAEIKQTGLYVGTIRNIRPILESSSEAQLYGDSEIVFDVSNCQPLKDINEIPKQESWQEAINAYTRMALH
jgi:hypothetical protein